MKKILTVVTLAAAIVLTGCNKHELDEGMGNQGCLQLSVSMGSDQYTVRSTSADDVDIDSFILTFTTSSNSAYKLQYTFGDFKSTFDDSIIYMDPGDYTITVTSPDTEDVAWDQPIYGCTKDFTVKSEVITALELVCTIQNMLVTVETTAEFRAEFYDYNIKITGTYDSGEETLTWTEDKVDEGAEGYFKVSDLQVDITGIRASGTVVTESRAITDCEAADHHIITIGATTTGSANVVGITIDDSTNDKDVEITVPGLEEPDIPDPDEPEDNNGGDDSGNTGNEGDDTTDTTPTATWSANPGFDPMYLASTMDVDILVSAPEGIKTFLVGVDSATLSGTLSMLGISLPMDIIYDTNAVSLLGTLGVPVGEDLVGATSVDFDISNLAPMIYALKPSAGSEHVFTLIVTDAKDQTLEKAITFIMPEE
ncbi:MAG: DUF4493 domain-containing protein [Bacteroidales bacterium]|nr:DUF4493 domain-containing protein [Bacteroidales bacterium]